MVDEECPLSLACNLFDDISDNQCFPVEIGWDFLRQGAGLPIRHGNCCILNKFNDFHGN